MLNSLWPTKDWIAQLQRIIALMEFYQKSFLDSDTKSKPP